jgi:hypothetical protein
MDRLPSSIAASSSSVSSTSYQRSFKTDVDFSNILLGEQLVQQFIGRQDCVRKHWAVSLSRLHSRGAERGRSVLHQRDVIAQFHAEASGGLDATVGDQADQDDFLNAVLLEL